MVLLYHPKKCNWLTSRATEMDVKTRNEQVFESCNTFTLLYRSVSRDVIFWNPWKMNIHLHWFALVTLGKSYPVCSLMPVMHKNEARFGKIGF